MELNVDQAAIEAAISESATKALAEALGGWEIRKALANIVTTEVVNGALADVVKTAVQKVDRDKLTNALADELQRAVTRAVISILNEGLVEIVCKLRGIGTYGEDVNRRAIVKAELTGNAARAESTGSENGDGDSRKGE